jgi:hypothetical protein
MTTPVLTEELRRAHEATDQVLSNRPDDEFVIIYRDDDGMYLYVMDWDEARSALISGVSDLEQAARFEFCEALDVKAALVAAFDEVVVMLVGDAPPSLVYLRLVDDDREEQ